jgi:hypothetical protein
MNDYDSPNTDGPLTGDHIADAARSMLDNNTYQLYSYNDGVPSGQAKDHQFVSNVLGKLGLGFDGDIDKHPSADDWGNPRSSIPGFRTVNGPPQAGDILATQKPIQTDWYYGGGQQMGIATGKDSSVGILNNMRIGESDFGLKDGHEPTIWRSDAVESARQSLLDKNSDSKYYKMRDGFAAAPNNLSPVKAEGGPPEVEKSPIPPPPKSHPQNIPGTNIPDHSMPEEGWGPKQEGPGSRIRPNPEDVPRDNNWHFRWDPNNRMPWYKPDRDAPETQKIPRNGLDI